MWKFFFESRHRGSEKNEKLVADMGRGKLSATQIQTAVFQSSGNLLSLSTINLITDYYSNGIINDHEFDALYPSGNQQQGWMFMSLSTGRVIHRHQWKKLPISQEIIDMVDQLGTKEKQSFISNNFKYRMGQNKRVNDEYEVDESDAISEQNSMTTGEDDVPKFHEISDDVNEITITQREAHAPLPTMQEAQGENDVIDNEANNETDQSDQMSTDHDVGPDVINSNYEVTVTSIDDNSLDEDIEDTEVTQAESNDETTMDDEDHINQMRKMIR